MILKTTKGPATTRWTPVYQSKYGKVRIFKIKKVSKKREELGEERRDRAGDARARGTVRSPTTRRPSVVD